MLAAAGCIKPSEIGALIAAKARIHHHWPHGDANMRAAGELNATESKKRGPKVAPARDELKQLALMTRERDRLRVQLSNAQLVIEVQKKLPRCWINSSRHPSSRVLDDWHV